MAERVEEAEAEAGPERGSEAMSTAAALAVGLRKGAARHAADPKLDAFLAEQTDLVRLQKEHLHAQAGLVLSRLRWGRFSDRMKALLQVMTAAVGLAVAAGVAAMAWQAHEDHGLTVAAFSVPPDLAQMGLTGQVVATKVLDRLSQMQAETATNRPASTYAENWGEDIKVEIPETGISVGELDRWLREKLGHGTRITGEVVRTPTGVSVTARAGAEDAKSFAGAEADIDLLLGQAAESLYAATQPYRYAVWLDGHGRHAEALADFQKLATDGAAEDRPWADMAWATALLQAGDIDGARGKVLEAIALMPKALTPRALLGSVENAAGHYQAFVEAQKRMYAAAMADPKLLDRGRANARAGLAITQGDIAGNLAGIEAGLTEYKRAEAGGLVQWFLVEWDKYILHDVTGARRVGLEHGEPAAAIEAKAAASLDDWGAAAKALDAAPQLRLPGTGGLASTASFTAAPVVLAHVGRFAESEALLAATPLDNDGWVADRGEVAALKGDWLAADRWFSLVVARAPDEFLVYPQWARLLLRRGDVEGAIAKASAGHARSPRFADPLEVWGEALMRKQKWADAAAKFAEADKDAPRWGRNHLLWGEALMLQGRYRQARAQYEAANGLDLSKPDRAALDVLLARTAKEPLHG